ncbi:DnaJ like protein subfamily C member 2 [Angomonas deanei]|nr:DnaJ like protein subfamily C member 2 [Angomonas deanei]|eukprot:EPY37769.1 DnaJ like protein subfamily C member 2 [Angomonas deanei]
MKGKKADNTQSEEADTANRYQSSKKKKFVKLTEEDLEEDWYDVLKVEQGDSATVEQLRAAYRRRCLETHPDKQPNHSDELFKKVQKAFDILGDPEIRQSYDCSRPFDETIPGETVEEKEFFNVFAPVFERNKKWSKDATLPSLGDDSLPISDVYRFYDRWNTYQSWRDFSQVADLEEIQEDMPREEKRYYMRENERVLNQYRKEEKERIRSLIERARKNDPRIRRHREEEEAKRKQEVAEREAFRNKLLSEQMMKEREKEEQEKARKDEERRKVMELKNAIRGAEEAVVNFFRAHKLLEEGASQKYFTTIVQSANIRWLYSKVSDPEEAKSIEEKITSAATTRAPCPGSAAGTDGYPDTLEENDAVPAVIAFNQLVQAKERDGGFTRYGEPVKKKPVEKEKKPVVAAPKAPTAEWTEEDLSRLQKATAKFPPGTTDRWAKITALLKNRFTEEEALAKVNELQSALSNAAAAAPATPPVEEWTVKQQKQLEQGLRELKDYKEKDKFQKIAKMVDGKTAKECFDRFKFLCSVNKKGK